MNAPLPTPALTLTKHHGLGNDFLVTFDDVPADAAAFARAVCNRRTGIGADGLLIGSPGDGHDATMTLYNADGSRAEISGNGIRCFAQALAMRTGSLAEQTIGTDAGTRTVTLTPTADPLTIEASVDMGDVAEIDEPAGWHRLGTDPHRPVAHLSVGNPHSVVAVDDVAAVDLLALGRQVPDVNLEIVAPGPGSVAVTMRVHERGAGITLACGSGAVAAARAAHRWGLVEPGADEIAVHMDGGSARVALDRPHPGRATLIGPATYIGRIEVPAT